MTRVDTLVVGAGISGLICGRDPLLAGHDVLVVEKESQVGGRVATARIGDGVYDYGAQFFTARTERFGELVGEMLDAGVVRVWFRGSPENRRGRERSPGHPRYCGVGGMAGIAEYLARGARIEPATTITSVANTGGTWLCTTEGEAFRSTTVVMTLPVPQTLELLSNGGVELEPAWEATLRAVQYAPCLAVFGVPAVPLELPPSGVVTQPSPGVSWVADNMAKRASPIPSITVHCTPELSRAHFDRSDAAVLEAVRRDLGDNRELRRAVHDGFTVRRWRHARPASTMSTKIMTNPRTPGLILSGDAFSAPRLEGAALSGYAAASACASRGGRSG